MDTKEGPKPSSSDVSVPQEQARTTNIDPVGAIAAAPDVQGARVPTSPIKKIPTGLPMIPAVNGTHPTRPSFSISSSRAMRHRKMAALYQRLAQLHREEAEEAEAFEESQYADDVEREEAFP